MRNQMSFSTKDHGTEAKAMRDAEAKERKAAGQKTRKWTLRNQIWKTMYDEGYCTVYMLNIG